MSAIVSRLALLLASVALVASPSACSVASLQGAEYTGPKNTCNAGCSAGATCVQGACRATKTNYKMMLEVTPPSNAHYASDVTFPIDLGGGTGGEHDLTLDALAQVTLTIDASGVPGVAKGVPLAVRLTRVGSLPGLAATTYDARSDATAKFDPGKGSVFIAVPPGDYDVYLTPLDPDTLAVLPPLDLGLVRASLGHFTAGPQERVVVVNALKPFDLTITDEEGSAALSEAVDGYDVSVIDRVTGKLVSTVDRTCTHPGSAHLLLSPGLNQHTYSVRFSPPTEKCDSTTDPPLRPTYEFDLDALNVDGTSVGTVAMPRVATLLSKTDGKSAPITVNVGGHVKNKRTGGSETPVKAGLVFRSRKLSIPITWKTGSAYYQTTGSTSTDDGSINFVQLPAGQYDVQIVPSLVDTGSSSFAVAVAERRDLTATNNTLELSVSSKTIVRGAPVSSEGYVFELGTADFLAGGTNTVATGSLFAPLARSKTVTLGKNGFSTGVDPGIYDLVVRIPEESGYAWIVAPKLDLTTPAAAPTDTCTVGIVCMKPFVAAAPVVLTGKVVDPNGDPVARAALRARAVVFEGDPETTPALRAIVVGETKTEEDGSYVLVVPSDFVKPAR
jgi:hypothetical protein